MRLSYALPLIACLSVVPASFADTIIDQQNTAANSTRDFAEMPGQSFTPTASSISFSTFSLALADANDAQLIFAILFAGDGFQGNFTTSLNNALVTSTTFSPFTFYFSPAVSLTPGDVYTLQLVAIYPGLNVQQSSGDAYAGGQEYLSGEGYDAVGVAETGYDLTFSEGYIGTAPVSATPEPGSLALLGTGLVGVITLVRKRRSA